MKKYMMKFAMLALLCTSGVLTACKSELDKCVEGDVQACKALSSALAIASAKFKVEFLNDSRDGKTYRIVKIGSQSWMAENLNYNSPESLCAENDENNCQKYGRLYSVYKKAVLKTVCPEGWRVPTVKDWNNLFSAVGAKKKCGNFGYEGETGNECDYIYWQFSGDNLNKSGFEILMGGEGDTGGDEPELGLSAHFVALGNRDDEFCFSKKDSGISDGTDYCGNGGQTGTYSVRCIKK